MLPTSSAVLFYSLSVIFVSLDFKLDMLHYYTYNNTEPNVSAFRQQS